jgi:hypothetical protein
MWIIIQAEPPVANSMALTLVPVARPPETAAWQPDGCCTPACSSRRPYAAFPRMRKLVLVGSTYLIELPTCDSRASGTASLLHAVQIDAQEAATGVVSLVIGAPFHAASNPGSSAQRMECSNQSATCSPGMAHRPITESSLIACIRAVPAGRGHAGRHHLQQAAATRAGNIDGSSTWQATPEGCSSLQKPARYHASGQTWRSQHVGGQW